MRKPVPELNAVPDSQADPVVLDKKAVAKILLVKPATVYELTRTRATNPLPFFKVGKYIRFERGAILAWMREQQEQGRRAA